METNKKTRVIKDYEKLDKSLKEKIKKSHPNGYNDDLVFFTNKEGKLVSALPFETEDKYYLVRITTQEEVDMINNDDEDNDNIAISKESPAEFPNPDTEDDPDIEIESDIDIESDIESDDNFDPMPQPSVKNILKKKQGKRRKSTNQI
ncbi:MAG: hypothetical protein JJE45_02920 [Prolixibacteraceae bacterium]|nr:hypothetical protein [Prolixibacteraceae bacterium]